MIDTFDKYLESGDLDQTEKSKRDLELLSALHPEKEKYPTPPFDTQLLIKFLLPQLFPFASLVIGMQSNSKLSTFIDFAGSLFGK